MRPDDDNYLAQSIAKAFERLPEPEAARLEALERRLAVRIGRPGSTKRPRAGFWWLTAVLFATGAAAWWGGEHWYGAVSREPGSAASGVVEKAEHDGAREAGQGGKDGTRPNAEPESKGRTPEIYRREVY